MLHKIMDEGIYSGADESAFYIVDLSTILYIGALFFSDPNKDTLTLSVFFKHHKDRLHLRGKVEGIREEHKKLVEAWIKFKEK